MSFAASASLGRRECQKELETGEKTAKKHADLCSRKSDSSIKEGDDGNGQENICQKEPDTLAENASPCPGIGDGWTQLVVPRGRYYFSRKFTCFGQWQLCKDTYARGRGANSRSWEAAQTTTRPPRYGRDADRRGHVRRHHGKPGGACVHRPLARHRRRVRPKGSAAADPHRQEC